MSGNFKPNTIDLCDNSNDESDDTMLGDDYQDGALLESPDLVFVSGNINQNTERLDSFSFGGYTYKPGKTVELNSGDFLRITAIVPKPDNKSVFLRGLKFRRNRKLDGLMELKRNEVTMILNAESMDSIHTDIYARSVQTVDLIEDVLLPRRLRQLIKTNYPFPSLSFREFEKQMPKKYIEDNGRLVCRSKLVLVNKNEGCLQSLGESEADEGFAIDWQKLRWDFRGETQKGGICPDWLNGEVQFDEAERKRSTVHPQDSVPSNNLSRKRRYTLGDAFCGAGGVSRGAKAAGIRVDWGLDANKAAIDSYRKNFHRARCEAITAHDFVTVIQEDFKVDILHLSPPCQTFSPYHVHEGQHDETNQATFFAIEGLIKKAKPRVVTLEETFGLSAMTKHQEWFRAMIQVFTKHGFSVRWKVLKLCDFGLPQPRRRLFLLASCPGEPLPDFPKPTHCKASDLHLYPNLSPYTTVNDAISSIPRDDPLHNPDQIARCNQAPYDGNQPLRRTICCAGNQNYHPFGRRQFTLRELACLQGFPLEHQFDPQKARMQIGNAVPPIVAKVIYDHLRKHLLGVDGLE